MYFKECIIDLVGFGKYFPLSKKFNQSIFLSLFSKSKSINKYHSLVVLNCCHLHDYGISLESVSLEKSLFKYHSMFEFFKQSLFKTLLNIFPAYFKISNDNIQHIYIMYNLLEKNFLLVKVQSKGMMLMSPGSSIFPYTVKC